MEEKLPKGWQEVQFIEVLETLENGSRPKGGVQGITEGIPSLGGEHLNSNGSFNFEKIKYVPLAYAESRSRGLIKKYDSLIVKDGATTGKTSFVDESFPFKKAFVNEHVFICRPWDWLEKKIVYYFARSPIGNCRIMENFSGAAQGGINQKFARNTLIPLPPLPEQKRIVAKLDTLFASLDNTKAHLEKIPQLLKNFRQAVLTQAVTGKLTEEWRGTKSIDKVYSITIGNESDDKPDNWSWERLTDISKLESGHTPRKSKPEYWENGNIPWISLQDIRAADGKTIYTTKFMPNQTGIDNSSARLLPKGTVCFSRDISVGFVTIMGKEMATTQHFANFICSKKISNKFLMFAFIASRAYLLNSGVGTTVKTLYMPAIKNFFILLPPLDEQHEIIRRVESLFAKADAIEQQYQKLKEKVDALPQAILAKAFRGELVEQNPLDESASVLLERIRAEKEKVVSKGKKKTMKRKVDVAAEPKGKYGKKGNK